MVHWDLMGRKLILFTLLVLFLQPAGPALAQETLPEGPVYVVREGDTLWSIAVRFGVSVEDLQQVNQISNSNQLAVGDRLVIPGLTGVEGEIITQQIPYGVSLRSLSRNYQLDNSVLRRLNRLTSPSEIFAGSFLTIPVREDVPVNSSRDHLKKAQSLLEISLLNGSNPWTTVLANQITGSWAGVPGDVLFFSDGIDADQPAGMPGALPPQVHSISIDPLPFLQGKTTVLKILGAPDLQLSGSFIGHNLNIFQDRPGEYIALQGAHALAEPGLYELLLNGELADGTSLEFTQSVLVAAVDYPFDRPLTVDPTTIDPAVTKPEDAQWQQLASPATPDRMWDGIFQIPSPLPADYCIESGECWSSKFGNRRSYNGGPYNSFHTGLDIVGKLGTEIYAPAPGEVVFAGPLTVRGNATVINHGWGIYSAYMHQDEILVEVGDLIETGQLIGRVGNTGRVEGPHLHWEIWAGGVQVDPLDWLAQAYP